MLCSVQESEDIVSWHHKVQSRLKEITTSPTDYHSVLHTIQQLQVCVCVCVCVCEYMGFASRLTDLSEKGTTLAYDISC